MWEKIEQTVKMAVLPFVLVVCLVLMLANMLFSLFMLVLDYLISGGSDGNS